MPPKADWEKCNASTFYFDRLDTYIHVLTHFYVHLDEKNVEDKEEEKIVGKVDQSIDYKSAWRIYSSFSLYFTSL
jgi:hypothetical protein